LLSSIKERIIIFYVAVLFLVLPALGVFLYFSLDKITYNSIDSGLLSKAKALATLISDENDKTEFAFSDEIMGEYNSIRAKSFFQIRRFDGTPLEKSRSLGNLDLPFGGSEKRTSFKTINFNGIPLRRINFYFPDSLAHHGERKGPDAKGKGNGLIIQCAEDIQEQVTLLKNFRIILSLSLFSIMIISASGGFFIARKSLAPIKEISDTIRGISESRLSERITLADVPKELKGLAASFNQTFERLEKSFKRRKQFVADASHELRTPLSVILSQSEVMLRKERSAEEYKNALTVIEEAAGIMSDIVGKLLALARLSTEKAELKIEPINLNEVIHQAVKIVTPLATQKGIRISLPVYERPVIPGDRAALLELVGNVLDNAIKYNVSNGKIDIAIKKENPFLIIKIQDTGIGISRKDMDKVFDRFYRVDRSRSKEAGGIGLGLSISKEIVRLHGGKIEIESTIGTGTTVSIYLKENGYIATN
jgi:heavy metal sensor kinase